VIRPWTTLASKTVGKFRVFSVRSLRKQPPAGGLAHEFFVIDSVNWVNVIALTPQNELVLVEQYRHGSDTIELEVPGGMMDAGDASPAATGARELTEETGYEGGAPEVIGQVFPNPAIMTNICYTVLVPNCQLTGKTKFDATEDLATRLVPIAEAPALVAAGKIRHSLVIAALYHFDLWRKRGQSA
jgi:ADP-ribose pyrophosphatase